jgi:pimeloyl-ACP methyl ester carboxylesterase
MKRQYLGALAAGALAVSLALPAGAHDKSDGLDLADHGYFFAGGSYVPSGNDQIMAGQIYVEYFVPKKKKQKYPVVMVHGGGQTGTNFLKTPDGRDGWAHYFIRDGYTVYVIDQPARGRSVYHPSVHGAISGSTALTTSQRFTAPEKFAPAAGQAIGWPQARFHTQWPGTGLAGDKTFDQFYASQVNSAGNAEQLNQPAIAALLDKIGPAIIMTHSQSGPFGWAAAESRPRLVKAILAAEPSGPPFENAGIPWGTGGAARAWGVTSTPITYDPPITDPSQLSIVTEPSPDPVNLVSCKLQAEPARKLVNLRRIPILVFMAEASYHAGYDHCTAKYLKQAGASVDFVKLANKGMRGNGHMIMLEKNNARTAEFLLDWLDDNLHR